MNLGRNNTESSQMQANIEDVAKRAGVSIATVSRTFKHPELVAVKTRERVLEAANRLDFSISRSASIFQTGQTFRVALLINDRTSTWFNAHVYEGLNSVLNPAGYDIAFYRIGNSSERGKFFEDLPVRRNADAVIVTSFDIKHEEVARLNSMNVPVAGINAMPENAFTLSESIDDEHAMRLMTRHLIGLGHRDIAFVGMHPTNHTLHFSANMRAQGFKDECRKSGIDPIMIDVPDDEHTTDSALTQLLALERMPTAICCVQDSIAIPLLSRLQHFGHRIPEDISITGFDDDGIAGQVGLTTVRQDPVAMGASVARKILHAIEHDSKGVIHGNGPETSVGATLPSGLRHPSSSVHQSSDSHNQAEQPQSHEKWPTQIVFRDSTAPVRGRPRV